MSTNAITRGPRTIAGAVLGWVVLVPGFAVLLAWLIDFDGLRLPLSLVLLILTLMTARVVLGSTERGLVWRIVTYACAIGVTLPAILGQQAYLSLAGERVDAVVTREIDVTHRAVGDPATGEELGVLQGLSTIVGAKDPGDRVTVLVARGSGIDPLTVDRAGTGRTAAAVWVVSWLAGAALLVVSLARRRRTTRTG